MKNKTKTLTCYLRNTETIYSIVFCEHYLKKKILLSRKNWVPKVPFDGQAPPYSLWKGKGSVCGIRVTETLVDKANYIVYAKQ